MLHYYIKDVGGISKETNKERVPEYEEFKRRVKWTEAYKIKLREEIEKTKREAKKAEDKREAKEKAEKK